MLTAGLESAIQKGIAVYKTFCVGGSGVGTIPVPKNRFIVITDFDFFPFSDGDEGERNVYQVEFRSGLSQNHFIIRQPITQGAYQRNIYLVHSENVQIDIVNVPSPAGWATNFSALPEKSQESREPVGYGINGISAVRQINFSADEAYMPLTKLRDTLTPANYREQFRADVNAVNRLNNPQGTNDFFYPIMNVGYVLFEVNYNQYVKGTK